MRLREPHALVFNSLPHVSAAPPLKNCPATRKTQKRRRSQLSMYLGIAIGQFSALLSD